MTNSKMVLPEDSGLVGCAGAERITGLSYTTLARFRSEGIGPEYIRTGSGHIYYKQSDLVDWMASDKRFYPDGSFGPDVLVDYQAKMSAPPQPPNEGDKEPDATATAAE